MNLFLQELPKTSKYKLIDYWLLVCFNILVITLGFHTYVASIIYKSKREPKNKNKNIVINSTIIKVGPEDMNDTHFVSKHQQVVKYATWLNDIAKIIFIVSLIVFNLIFWTIALVAFFRSSDVIISSHLSH